MASLSFKEVPAVNSAQYHQQFSTNKLRIEGLTRDVQNPTLYRNTNLKASFIAILTVAAIGAVYYYFFYSIPKSLKQSMRVAGDYNFGPEIATGLLQLESYFVGTLVIALTATLGFWGAYSFARSQTNDRALLESLNKRNTDLQSEVQRYITECDTNMQTCDRALSQGQLADGRGVNERENPIHIAADWTQTPWRALEEIADRAQSMSVLSQVQGLDAQGRFLQAQTVAITQFRQENEVAKRKLEALQLLLT